MGTATAPNRILLLGGTSEIGLAILSALNLGPDTQVLLAGRDLHRLAEAGAALPAKVSTIRYDAADLASHDELISDVFADGPLDLVISAAGVLASQEQLDGAPGKAGELVQTNFTGHVTSLLAVAARMRAQASGTIVVLSSIAAVRPRKANFVYGAAKAGLDAFARGLTDSLHGSGVRVVLVRPGFVIGRMTAGMPPAPLATTPARVGAATAAALRGRKTSVWIPAPLAGLSVGLRLVPRPAWRRVSR